MALEKATIEIVNGKQAGARIGVLFNPSEYSIEHGNTYKSNAIPGRRPLVQFVNGDAEVLTMELFLDDYTDPPAPGESSVQDRLVTLVGLLAIDRQLHAPPLVRFVWGALDFQAVIEKLGRKITLFHSSGVPARATLNVTFREYESLREMLADPALESADKTKRRVLDAADSLWAMAFREYGDVRRWRLIADANDLDDPRDAEPGDWVTLPAVDDSNGPGTTL